MNQLIAEFEIDKLPQMINAIGRKHWAVKHRERKIWQRLINEQCNYNRICGLNLEKAVITLTRHSNRRPDPDGLVSGFKAVLDSLVKCGVLVDDNFGVIGFPIYKWELRPSKLGGRITVKIEVETELE